jgi:hypothetical protein
LINERSRLCACRNKRSQIRCAHKIRDAFLGYDVRNAIDQRPQIGRHVLDAGIRC